MPYGRFYGAGRGIGLGLWRRGGSGFGFKGSSPPWPYVGLGRGGLPRCSYFLGGVVGVPSATYPMSREEELDFLKNEAEAIRGKLRRIESRIRQLEESET